MFPILRPVIYWRGFSPGDEVRGFTILNGPHTVYKEPRVTYVLVLVGIPECDVLRVKGTVSDYRLLRF